MIEKTTRNQRPQSAKAVVSEGSKLSARKTKSLGVGQRQDRSHKEADRLNQESPALIEEAGMRRFNRRAKKSA